MIGHGFISYKDSVSGGYQNYKDDLTTIREIKALDGSYYRIFNTRAYRGLIEWVIYPEFVPTPCHITNPFVFS